MTSSEKRLLTIFSGAVFILANGFGFFMISNAMDTVSREKSRVTQRINSLNQAKLMAPEAELAREWMNEHVKTYADEFQRDSHLDSLIKGRLTDGLSLDVRKNFPLRTDDKGEHFVKSRYQATVQGPWLDVKEFIFRLQKPTELRFVPRINMVPRKSETDDAEQEIEITVELEQWWAKPDDFVMTEEEPAAETPAGEAPAAATPPAETPPANEQNPPAAVETPAAAPPAPATPESTPTESPAENPTDSPKPNP